MLELAFIIVILMLIWHKYDSYYYARPTIQEFIMCEKMSEI